MAYAAIADRWEGREFHCILGGDRGAGLTIIKPLEESPARTTIYNTSDLRQQKS